MEWTLSSFNSCLSHYFRQFVLFIVKFTSGLEKDLQEKTSKSESKSESRGFKFKSKSKSKSKSGKNGLESGLESKSGLEYYKSGINKTIKTSFTFTSYPDLTSPSWLQHGCLASLIGTS